MVKTWPLKRMDELCEVTSSKRIYAADYVSAGVPFYRGREVTEKYKGNLNVSTELFITEERFWGSSWMRRESPVAGSICRYLRLVMPSSPAWCCRRSAT